MVFHVTKEGAAYYIKWVSKPISEKIYTKFCKWIKSSTDYSQLNPKTMLRLRAYVHELNNTLGGDLTIDCAISIRNIILKDKIIKGYPRMNSKIAEIAGKYNKGVGILNLSHEYDFPPLNLLRGIFLKAGYNPTEIYSVFANKEDPAQLLKDRDLMQYNIASTNDAESTFNIQRTAKIGADNEETFVKFFQAMGIGLRTQDELTREQIEQHGRAVITPDILFTSPVFINGVEVKWIDYKDYTGTKIHFLYSSNVEQAQRYVTKWGPGALCYHYSFIEGILIPSAELLDVRALSIKLI